MKIIKPYVEVDKFNPDQILRHLEYKGRVCYKSEDRITVDSAERFVTGLIQRGHESVLEHESLGVKFVVDRGVSHEIVRHRLAAYSQESTRYCNYGNNGEDGITVILPWFFSFNMLDSEGLVRADHHDTWRSSCVYAEGAYLGLLMEGATPQEARSVLPNSLKTEIEVTYNLREWRHFFLLRCSKAAHPQMQQVAIPLLGYMQERLPEIFGDIEYNDDFPTEHYALVWEREI